MSVKKSKICAIVVTYFPKEDIFEQYKTLKNQCDCVIWVDNTPEENPVVQKIEKFTDNKTKILIKLGDNYGIAKALNEGINFALNKDFDWILTMDQDSFLEENMIENQLRSYQEVKDDNIQRIWAISPVYKDINTGHISIQKETSEDYAVIDTTMTSGMLIKVKALEEIGLFEEKYFVYHVDTEYCLRAKKKGYTLLESNKAILLHEEGNQTKHKFLWKKGVITTNHSPLARYYMARNTIFLMKDYFLIFPKKLSVIFFHHYIISTSKIVLFEKDKTSKLWSQVKGFVDGVLN